MNSNYSTIHSHKSSKVALKQTHVTMQALISFRLHIIPWVHSKTHMLVILSHRRISRLVYTSVNPSSQPMVKGKS